MLIFNNFINLFIRHDYFSMVSVNTCTPNTFLMNSFSSGQLTVQAITLTPFLLHMSTYSLVTTALSVDQDSREP